MVFLQKRVNKTGIYVLINRKCDNCKVVRNILEVGDYLQKGMTIRQCFMERVCNKHRIRCRGGVASQRMNVYVYWILLGKKHLLSVSA